MIARVRVDLGDQVFSPALIDLLQSDFQSRKALAEFRQKHRNMLAHRLHEPRQFDHAAHLSLYDFLHFVQSSEKRSDKIVKGLSGRRQPERPSLEEPHPEVRFEPRHLRAYRGLLDPLKNLPAGCHDALASCDVIE